MQRFVLGALRAATGPVTSLEIAIEVAKDRGLDPSDARAVSLIRKRVGACLFKLNANGVARDVPTTGRTRGGREPRNHAKGLSFVLIHWQALQIGGIKDDATRAG
jgi:hypothetical protein